jgi:hypothetical protein
MASDFNNIHDLRQFIKLLNETIHWCREAGSPSQPQTSLRTCRRDLVDLHSQRHQVSSVSHERSHRLFSSGKRNLSLLSGLCGGRLLAYFPDDNLSDGFAETVSKGFFDVNNIPPHDTWVWMVHNMRAFKYSDGASGEMEANYLVAWVPPDFIELASRGVDVNPEGCILWLDTIDDEFVRSLRRLGLFNEAFSLAQ